MPTKTDPKTSSPTVADLRRHDNDVGSPEVQITQLTARIISVTGHLKQSPKDKMARRGLLQMVGQRRRHLDWLIAHRPKDYQSIIKKLNIRK